jgi:hypothetical protein
MKRKDLGSRKFPSSTTRYKMTPLEGHLAEICGARIVNKPYHFLPPTADLRIGAVPAKVVKKTHN